MKWKDKTVLITGFGGFIGSNLTKYLLKRHAKIIGIDNFSYVAREWCEDTIDKIDFIEGDVAKRKTFQKIKDDIDYIFHFAAPSSVILFNRTPRKCYLETVLGTLNVFEFAKERGVKKIIYPSSGSVYGGNQPPHRENVYPRPLNLYGAAKIACEMIASNYQPFVKSVGLRIFAGYGPGEERKGSFASVVYIFLNDIINDRRPIVYGDGKQERDFIYIDDIIEAIIKAVEIDFNGIINVGTGCSTSFSKLIKIIQEILGKNVNPIYVPKQKGYVEKIIADTTLMKKLLKIEPRSLEEGIKEFLSRCFKK